MTFTYPYGTFDYQRMSFRLSNVPSTFYRCTLAIVSECVENLMELFMDDLVIHEAPFDLCFGKFSLRYFVDERM